MSTLVLYFQAEPAIVWIKFLNFPNSLKKKFNFDFKYIVLEMALETASNIPIYFFSGFLTSGDLEKVLKRFLQDIFSRVCF